MAEKGGERDQWFEKKPPITAAGWSSLRKSSEPVFDPTRQRLIGRLDENTARPRLLGMYEEWGIPFWLIFLITAVLPVTPWLGTTAFVTALRKGAWLPIGFNSAYWFTIFLVYWARH